MNLTFAPVYNNEENKERKFKIGKFRELNIYGAEIIDLTGEASKDEALFGGQDILLMGLTEDEFKLKDTDKNALCALIDTLVKELPKDRLISFKQTNYKGDLVDKKIEPRTNDIDGGKYQNFLKSSALHIPNDIEIVVNADFYLAANYCQRAMTAPEELRTEEFSEKLEQIRKITAKKLKAMPEFVYVYNKSLGERYPTIGPNGAMWAFTMENLAKSIIEKNPIADLEYKVVNAKQMQEIVLNMYRIGIREIVFNPGFDFAFALKREEFIKPQDYSDSYIANSVLHALAIHFLQNKAVNAENCQKAANELWKLFSSRLREALFLVPMLYEEDIKGGKVEDKKLHYTPTALDIVKNNDIVFWNMKDFDTEPQEEDKNFNYLTLKASAPDQPDQLWIPAFTDIDELRSIIGGNTRIAIATMQELNLAAAKLSGICINPKGINLRLEVQKKEDN